MALPRLVSDLVDLVLTDVAEPMVIRHLVIGA